MNRQLPESVYTEEMRIRAAYAKRQGHARHVGFSPNNLFMLQEQARRVLAVLYKSGITSLGTKTILDVGCGTGSWLRQFIQWGARPEHLTGIDLLAERIAEAKQLCPEGVTLQCDNATQLAFPDAYFDLVLQSVVFTSILDPTMKHRVAAEMIRVVKRDGLILWYDFHVNNPRNPDVRGVKKREIAQLFPDCHIALQRITLVPPLLRLLSPYSWLVCYLLSTIPCFCTHYLGVIRKR